MIWSDKVLFQHLGENEQSQETATDLKCFLGKWHSGFDTFLDSQKIHKLAIIICYL